MKSIIEKGAADQIQLSVDPINFMFKVGLQRIDVGLCYHENMPLMHKWNAICSGFPSSFLKPTVFQPVILDIVSILLLFEKIIYVNGCIFE